MSSSSSSAVAGDHCRRPGCPGDIMPTPTGELLCSYCNSQFLEQTSQPGLKLFSRPGDNCNRPGCAGSLSGDDLVCSDCHSSIVEQFLSNRSPPRSIPPPSSSSAATRLSNVLDQQPAAEAEARAGHGRILNLNLDLDAVVEEIRQLQENNPNWGINVAPEAASTTRVVQELADVDVVNEENSESECVMCRARFGNGLMQQQQQQVKRLPCGHLYHRGCILTWFNLCVQFDKALVCRVPFCGFRFSPAPVVSGDQNTGGSGSGSRSEHE